MKIKLLFFLIIVSFVNAQQNGKNKTISSKNKNNKIELLKPQEMICSDSFIRKPFEPLKPLNTFKPFKPIYKYVTFKNGKCYIEFFEGESKESMLSKQKELEECNKNEETYSKDLSNYEEYIKKEKDYELAMIDYKKNLQNYLHEKEEYDKCLAYNNKIRIINDKKSETKNTTNISAVNNYDGYESVSVTSGDVGCSNVIPRYDYSLNTSLLVKNYGDLDLVIKLINLEDNIASRMVYIRKNSSFQIKNIPQGKYIIKEAHGEVWKQKNIDGKCVGIFTKNAMYRQGKNIPDFNIRKRIEGNYEVTEIPYYELELGIKIITKPGEKVRSTYQSNSITSSEFNK